MLEAQQKAAGPAKGSGSAKTPRTRGAERAASDWLNAQGAWQQYAERTPISAALRRLERLQQVAAIDLLAGQHQDLTGLVHRAAAGRLFLATALLHRNQLDQARSTLKALNADLAAVRDSGWHKELTGLLERVPASQSTLRDMIKGLSDNLGPRGSLFWLQQRVDFLLAAAST